MLTSERAWGTMRGAAGNDAMKNAVPSLLLLLTAVIFWAAFLAQKSGSGHLGAFAFTGARSLLGGVSLTALVLILEKPKGTHILLTLAFHAV